MNKRDQLIQELEKVPDHVVEKLLDIFHQLQAHSQLSDFTSDQSNALTLDAFVGALKDSPSFPGDPLVVQRQMRDEWD